MSRLTHLCGYQRLRVAVERFNFGRLQGELMAYRVLDRQIRQVIGEAAKASQHLREVCGALVYNGHFLQLVPIRNTSKRIMQFILHRGDLRRISRAAKTVGASVVGTYHSHVVSEAKPGPGDIQGAHVGDLMLIIDASDKTYRLWRIGQRRAFPLAVVHIKSD